MILPLIIRTAEEATLKSVPDSYREASFGLGAGKLKNHLHHCSAISSSWYSGRCDPGHRTCDRRNSSPDLYSRYSCRGTSNLMGSDVLWHFICMCFPVRDFILIRHYATAVVVLIVLCKSISCPEQVAKRIAKRMKNHGNEKITVENLICIMEFHALKNINMAIPEKWDYRIYRSMDVENQHY